MIGFQATQGCVVRHSLSEKQNQSMKKYISDISLLIKYFLQHAKNMGGVNSLGKGSMECIDEVAYTLYSLNVSALERLQESRKLVCEQLMLTRNGKNEGFGVEYNICHFNATTRFT